MNRTHHRRRRRIALYVGKRESLRVQRLLRIEAVGGADAPSTTAATEAIATQRGERGDGPTGGGA